MSEKKVSEAENVLRGIVLGSGGTPDGLNWLETAIDPFHDKAIPLRGYPDTQASSSVVQLIKQSITISAPPTLTTGTWDVNIASLPVVATSLGNKTIPLVSVKPFIDSSGRSTNLIDTRNGGGYANSTPYTGLAILSGPTGSTLDASMPDGTLNTVATNLTLPQNYWQDSARVIGLGFEVHNTTSALNAQGSVCVYRVPTNPYQNATASTLISTLVNTVGQSACSINSIPSIPSTTAGALLYNGSKQWSAIEGCYCVNTFNSADIPENCASTTNPLYYINTPNDTLQYMPAPSTTAAEMGTVIWSPSNFWANVNIAGAYFTGLSLQTTLTINYNIYIERFPSQNSSDLVVMAEPSPGFDPAVLAMYAKCARELPVGVPVRENGLGDWFAGAVESVFDTLSTVADVAAPALSMVPATRGIGAALSIGNQFYKNARAKSVPRAPPIRASTQPQQKKRSHASVVPAQLQNARKRLRSVRARAQAPNAWTVPTAPPISEQLSRRMQKR